MENIASIEKIIKYIVSSIEDNFKKELFDLIEEDETHKLYQLKGFIPKGKKLFFCDEKVLFTKHLRFYTISYYNYGRCIYDIQFNYASILFKSYKKILETIHLECIENGDYTYYYYNLYKKNIKCKYFAIPKKNI